MKTAISGGTPRRAFLASTLRGGALMGMVLFVVREQAKGRRLENDPECLKLDPCAACGSFAVCEQPKARSARQAAV